MPAQAQRLPLLECRAGQLIGAPLKQRIADGVAKWLREQAPVGIKMQMDKKQFDDLVQAICDEFTADDFEKR